MNLSLKSLREHPEAVEKYKNRFVKVLNTKLNLWYVGLVPYSPIKIAATQYTLFAALVMCTYCTDIEFYFVDEFGYDTLKISDFDAEDVHNCPSIKFDALTKGSKL